MAHRRQGAMREIGVTQYDLAALWGKSQPFISTLMNGVARSYLLECDFARMCGLAYEQLWPEHPVYGTPSNPKRLPGSEQDDEDAVA